MHIYFKRSGGFMGIPVQGEVNTSSLPADQAETIKNMLADANFFNLPSTPEQVDNAADRFTYELRVVNDEGEHTVCFSEQNVPMEINTLMRHLTTLARRSTTDDSETDQ